MLSSSLPSELVSEILAQLPVKSLLRFRCISKPYDSVISSSSFISKHLNHAIEIGNECFILGIRFRGADVILPTISGKDSSDLIPDLCLHRVNQYDRLRFVGSCNGLVCLTKMDEGAVNFLWNPATRDFRALPISPVEKYTYSDLVFGYDSHNNDYKLLRLTTHFGLPKSQYPNSVYPISRFSPIARQFLLLDLYAKSTNSWRAISTDKRFNLDIRQHSPFLNGSFHWYDVSNRSIVSFDICNEVFKTLPSVNFSQFEENQPGWILDSMNGSLAMVTYPDHTVPKRSFTVWVMHDYGVDGYWTKQFCIESFSSDRSPIPIGILNDFELLIQALDTQQFFSYKLDKDEMSSLSVHLEKSLGVGRYVESLVRTHL